MIFNYLGVTLGFLNGFVLVPILWIHNLDKWGLIGVIMSYAFVLHPFFSWGISQTLIKFYSVFSSAKSKDSFLSFVLLFPAVSFCICFPVFFVFKDAWLALLADNTPLFKEYWWVPFPVLFCIVYFEIFCSYSSILLQTVFFSFLKNVYTRLVLTLLIVCFYYEIITTSQMIYIFIAAYVLQVLALGVYVLSLRSVLLNFNFRGLPLRKIFHYTFFNFLGCITPYMITNVDKIMIGRYLDLQQVAIYASVFNVVVVLQVVINSMAGLVNSLSAQYFNSNKWGELEKLYKKTSLLGLAAGGTLFILIVVNLKSFFELLPETYTLGFWVVPVICLAKLFELACGANLYIIINSPFYKYEMILGIFLLLVMIVSNIIFIPVYAITGAAVASLITTVLFNSLRCWVIYRKLKIQPFALKHIYVTFVIGAIIALVLSVPSTEYVVVDIAFKSILAVALYGSFLFKSNYVPQINKYIKRQICSYL